MLPFVLKNPDGWMDFPKLHYHVKVQPKGMIMQPPTGKSGNQEHHSITWQPNLAAALDRARQERRFVLADFSKEH